MAPLPGLKNCFFCSVSHGFAVGYMTAPASRAFNGREENQMLKRRESLNLILIILPALIVLTSAISISNPEGRFIVQAAAPMAAPRPSPTNPAIPSKQAILTLMLKVNSWQLAHPVMKPGDRNWERGTWYTGVMEGWKATKDRTFLDQALAWGREGEWRVGTEPNGANRLFCVETWTELYFVKKDHAMIEPKSTWIRSMARPHSPCSPRPPTTGNISIS